MNFLSYIAKKNIAFSSKTKHLPLKFIKILRDGKTEYAVKIRYNLRILVHEIYQKHGKL